MRVRPQALSWLTNALCILATALAGMVGGIAVATRLLSSSVEGLDQLAGALAGFVIGGLAGLAAGIVLSRVLTPRRRVLVAILAFLAAVATMWYLQAAPASADRIGPRAVRAKTILT